MEPDKVLDLALQRINHLEGILASSLFGLIITSTLAVYSAAYGVGQNSNRSIAPTTFLFGANILYGYLSGYYYFMLTHFYATAAIVVDLHAKMPELSNVSYAWSFFEIGGILWWLNERARNTVALFSAPLFPLSLSCVVITSLWYHFRKQNPRRIGASVLLASILFHILLFATMISNPFLKFLYLVQP